MDTDYIYQFSDQWINICVVENKNSLKFKYILDLLKKDDYNSQISGTLLMMYAVYSNLGLDKKRNIKYKNKNAAVISDIFSIVLKILKRNDPLSIFSASWCIAWSGYNNADIIPHELVSDIADRLINLWLSNSEQYDLKRVSSWALYSICMPNLHFDAPPNLKDVIEYNYISPRTDLDREAAIHLAVLNNYWTKQELDERINEMDSRDSRFLKECGLKKSKDLQEMFS